MIDLSTRRREAEWMDEPGADPVLLRKSLRFIRLVNWFLGYTRATISHLERFSSRWESGRTIRILDIGTGTADIPLAILRWADRRGLDVRVVGVDLHATTTAQAAAANDDARLKIFRANALELPFGDGAFDYTLTNMFLHHLAEDEIVRVFEEMGRVASRGVIAADLLRSSLAYREINWVTMFCNPMVRHDARVSIGQAFTETEITALRDRAGISFAAYHRHRAHRFVLAGEKPGV